MTATPTSTSKAGDLTFVLVHGSWHTGGSWSAVAAHLRDAGFASVSPTLAGHSPNDTGAVTHDDYTRSVLAALDATEGPVALVGHSFGGSVISRVAELCPDRCRLLVYYSAFVPRNAERVADSLPDAFRTFLDRAAEAHDGSVVLPKAVFRASFANTADEDEVDRIYAQLVPEPYAPIYERLDLHRLAGRSIPSAYVHCRQDLAMPAGLFHPGQSSRLLDTQLVEIDADHEALFTAPQQVAWALLQAAERHLDPTASRSDVRPG
jgi:pimeloyl-ACP methyl ester carboxylesterase